MNELPRPQDQAWSECLKVIKDNVTPQSFKTWFEPIKPVKLEGKILTIQVPSQFFYEWLEEHYVGLLQKTLKKVIGPSAKLEYNVIVENGQQGNSPYTVNQPSGNTSRPVSNELGMPIQLGTSIKNPFIIPGLKKMNIDSQLNAKYTFENFVEGECNKLARSAGLAVAQKPGGTAFNPLMIFGGCGLGKTHLAHAIGNMVKQIHRAKVVLFVSSEKFMNQFIDSSRNNSTADFVN
ncbi:MAG: hypothetical protein RLZZ370_1913, partial [Bacteroidota bacterium]